MPASAANYGAGRPGTIGHLAQLVLPVQFVSVQIPASPQLAVLPGPPAGSVRVVDFWTTSNSPTVVMSNVAVSLQPQNILYRLVSNIGSTQGYSRQVLAFGESIRVANGGAQTGVAAMTYYDLPDTFIGVVRAVLTDVFQTLIPVPPAGFQRRWLQVPAMTDSTGAPTGNAQRIIQTRATMFNTDTVSHTVEQGINGVLVARTGLLSIGDRVALTGIMQASVTQASGPMQYRTIAPQTTNPVLILGAYETLPL